MFKAYISVHTPDLFKLFLTPSIIITLIGSWKVRAVYLKIKQESLLITQSSMLVLEHAPTGACSNANMLPFNSHLSTKLNFSHIFVFGFRTFYCTFLKNNFYFKQLIGTMLPTIWPILRMAVPLFPPHPPTRPGSNSLLVVQIEQKRINCRNYPTFIYIIGYSGAFNNN